MQQIAGKFENVNGDLQGMLKTLINELEALQGAWIGAGARSFQSVKSQYADDQNKLQQALLATADAIRQSGRGYASSDEEASGRMNSINTGGVSLPL
jgi:WXG100 family type VII secretion target